MKIRNGFVSNSSSSSFVIIGNYINLSDFTVEQKRNVISKFEKGQDFLKDDEVDDVFSDFLYDKDLGFDILDLDRGYEYVVGHILAEAASDDGCFDDLSLDIKELSKLGLEKKRKIYELFGIDIELKLIIGTRPC